MICLYKYKKKKDFTVSFKSFYFCFSFLINVMAYYGNVPPPSCLGFVRNPNLVLPPYITTEVHLYRDEAGVLITHRRPRPLSVIAGAEFILQCDQDKLARLAFRSSETRLHDHVCFEREKNNNHKFYV